MSGIEASIVHTVDIHHLSEPVAHLAADTGILDRHERGFGWYCQGTDIGYRHDSRKG